MKAFLGRGTRPNAFKRVVPPAFFDENWLGAKMGISFGDVPSWPTGLSCL